MSHVTVLQGIVINDIPALQSAVAELNASGIKCHLVQNAKPRVHGYDAAPTCEWVLKLQGAYDVGFKKNEKGNYDPVFDTYQNHVGGQIGAACPMPSEYARRAVHQMGKLGQSYAKFAAMNTAAQEGYIIESCGFDANGSIQLVLQVQ